MNNKKWLLIVDDEYGIRESLKEYFEIQDFCIETAGSGKEALLRMEQQDFDLVLSDVRMPDGDGRYLLEKAKLKNVFTPHIVLMSGFTDLTLEEAYNQGAAALFIKPFNPVSVMQFFTRLALTPRDRWARRESSKVHKNILFQESQLSHAIGNKRINLGHHGFFIPAQKEFPKVEEKVEYKFSDGKLYGNGNVKWVRMHSGSEGLSGYALEFSSMSPELIQQVEDVLKTTKPIAAIPASL